ncbi:hypothetical protein [Spiroplasma platyhelix]|uniref:Uncharacterized protein n=1 Tax=Spiroplasma platyhelix PALS-1 TaxID=1276218 RepID=A0A846TWY6_9MOLU|nr:hypothetical protein [Spiroplasma platyhelix]MBE4704340.1 hypothetical protein [Spiroplasma platyhelix PALS-1]NKE38712.1 hypothetical protein [Spiroplasma platyhelix PALS-1]UJB28922.1 hypothetical protein SPLAT_v1c01570 [Spiroplasma platyhelix PALS-1]
MKNKQWFLLIGLKFASVVLHTITLGIPKLLSKIDSKVKNLALELTNQEELVAEEIEKFE